VTTGSEQATTPEIDYEACGFHVKGDPACICPEKVEAEVMVVLADVLRVTAFIQEPDVRAKYVVTDLKLRGYVIEPIR
jgi:hypothetical protein